jgi:O-antigen ligase
VKELGSEEKVRQQTVEKKWTTPAENRLPRRPQTLLGSAMRDRKRTFVFGALVAFSVLYFYRPEDFVPGLNYIPMAKIVAAVGFLALIFGVASSGKFKLPWALKILVLLLGQMTLAIPFALWRGGAFNTVFTRFSKGVVAALLIGLAVSTTRQIRKLLWIQVSAVALVTFLSIALNHRRDGRLEGIQNSILQNPNDLAINIAISFPLGVAFMLHARGFKKALWVIALAFMCLGVILTYSRSGLIAFIISIMVCVWEYGIKGKRRNVVILAGISLFVGLGVVASNSGYRARVESIVLGNIEGSHDKGSLEARKMLLKKSIVLTLTHPLFGVGPGGFVLVDNGWVVAHNTYTEVAAEAGIPALILFIMAIAAAFKNLSQVRKSQHYREDPEFRLFTQALRAGLGAFMVGACFASIEYNLYSYLIVAYTCAMVQIASRPLRDDKEGGKDQSLSKGSYDSIPRPQPIWSR